mgnify:CR=1 FL=1
MKYSWQRQIILETIQEHKEHLSAQKIYGYAVSVALISAWHGVPQV